MALERIEFERMYGDILPSLTDEERLLLEYVLGVSRNGKSPKTIFLASLDMETRKKLWQEVQAKLVNRPRRRGYGNG